MINKLKRLLAIPQPHRAGTVARLVMARFPKIANFRSQNFSRRMHARIAEQRTPAQDGPRYIAQTAHRIAGIGHVLSEYNTGLLVARGLDLEFLHSSLASPWEEFLGFGSNYKSLETVWKEGGFELVRLPFVDWKSSDVVAELRDHVNAIRSEKPILFLLFEGQNSFIQHTTGQELRSIYWAQAKRSGARILREPGKLNVAVHIRRRNAMDMKNASVQDTNSAGYRARYIDLDYFKQLMHLITTAVPDQSVAFHLFSQGGSEGFEPLLAFEDVRLHLDVDQYNTFHNMACADILITSPSSFSFKAGMLTPGLKLARYPWWHEIPEDSEWCRIPEAPELEAERITQFIQTNLPMARQNAAKLFPFSL